MTLSFRSLVTEESLPLAASSSSVTDAQSQSGPYLACAHTAALLESKVVLEHSETQVL